MHQQQTAFEKNMGKEEIAHIHVPHDFHKSTLNKSLHPTLLLLVKMAKKHLLQFIFL